MLKLFLRRTTYAKALELISYNVTFKFRVHKIFKCKIPLNKLRYQRNVVVLPKFNQQII